mmetsp:Transcript_21670/g.54445  ORF Transcript_21670/g.54445 Transcript_21670/m.54445 type:complete len:255 (-) Transcript_21670:265-1029(-)
MMMLRSTALLFLSAAPAALGFMPAPHGGAALRSGLSLGGAASAATRPQTSALSALSMEAELYGSKNSRSPLVEWMLVETNTPYKHREDRDGMPNPFGQIPAFRDGDVEVFESGAILLYIADKYGSASTPEERAKYTKWVVWANSALDKSLFTPDIDRRAPPLLSVLEKELEGKEWLEGEFGVADVAVGSYLLFIPMFHPQFAMQEFPNILAYMKRCVERPSYSKAFEANGPRAQAYVEKQMAAPAKKKTFGFQL